MAKKKEMVASSKRRKAKAEAGQEVSAKKQRIEKQSNATETREISIKNSKAKKKKNKNHIGKENVR